MKTIILFAAVALMISNCANPVDTTPETNENGLDSSYETGYIIIEGKGGNFCSSDTIRFTPNIYRMFSLNLSEPEPYDTTIWTTSSDALCNFKQGFITFDNCGRKYRIMLFK